MYYIFDCTGIIVGNPKGYRTNKGASIQANSWRSSTYKAIWNAFEKNKLVDPDNTHLHSIKFIKA